MNFESFWKIYEESFPPDERRSKEQQLEIFNADNYEVIEIKDESENLLVGFIAYWEFEEFIFVEHFAVASSQRGKGIGGKYLNDFVAKHTKPIVLEVEPPIDEMTKKRVVFYERLGWHLSDFQHIQKAYVPGRNGVLLQLMSYPNPLNDQAFQIVEETLFSTLYK